eukprot:201452_1
MANQANSERVTVCAVVGIGSFLMYSLYKKCVRQYKDPLNGDQQTYIHVITHGYIRECSEHSDTIKTIPADIVTLCIQMLEFHWSHHFASKSFEINGNTLKLQEYKGCGVAFGTYLASDGIHRWNLQVQSIQNLFIGDWVMVPYEFHIGIWSDSYDPRKITKAVDARTITEYHQLQPSICCLYSTTSGYVATRQDTAEKKPYPWLFRNGYTTYDETSVDQFDIIQIKLDFHRASIQFGINNKPFADIKLTEIVDRNYRLIVFSSDPLEIKMIRHQVINKRET